MIQCRHLKRIDWVINFRNTSMSRVALKAVRMLALLNHSVDTMMQGDTSKWEERYLKKEVRTTTVDQTRTRMYRNSTMETRPYFNRLKLSKSLERCLTKCTLKETCTHIMCIPLQTIHLCWCPPNTITCILHLRMSVSLRERIVNRMLIIVTCCTICIILSNNTVWLLTKSF